MQFLPSRYESDRCSNSINLLYGVSSSSKEIESLENPTMSSKSTVETAAAEAAQAACKSHSEAERRRRKRINGHLATLRTLLPNTIKTDKASLLAEVVRCVKELKKTTAEIVASSTDQTDGCSTTTSRVGNDRYNMIPSETDELKLSYGDGGDPAGTIKASVCCEDRCELIPELTRALNSIRAKVVRTEMATVGGRIKCVLWVQVSSVATGDEGLRMVRRALKVVMDRATLLALPGNKRPCLSHN